MINAKHNILLKDLIGLKHPKDGITLQLPPK